MKESIETNMITSLHRFRLGGTPMLMASVRKRKNDSIGALRLPLFLEIVRVWDEL